VRRRPRRAARSTCPPRRWRGWLLIGSIKPRSSCGTRLHYTDLGLVFAKEWGDLHNRADWLGLPLQVNTVGDSRVRPADQSCRRQANQIPRPTAYRRYIDAVGGRPGACRPASARALRARPAVDATICRREAGGPPARLVARVADGNHSSMPVIRLACERALPSKRHRDWLDARFSRVWRSDR
jgi:hypothetical protein